jgi:pimeloyl-ACP methyl ester carboxylesterase
LRENADGSVELACPAAVEAAVFANGASVDVEDLARRARVPATVLWAKRGSFSLPLYQRVFGLMERAEIREVDAGHLMPMEQPETVVDAVLEAADEVRR